MTLIEQGVLPPSRTMRDLFPGLVVEYDRPARDEPWCDIAAREGAHVGGGAGLRSDYSMAFDEWQWSQKHGLISKGEKHGDEKEGTGTES